MRDGMKALRPGEIRRMLTGGDRRSIAEGLATLAERRVALMSIVQRHLRTFERSPSKALQARAKQIRVRLSRQDASRHRRT